MIPPGYTCVALLGRGTFAEVWHVRRFGRDFACKIIRHKHPLPEVVRSEPANHRRCSAHRNVLTLHRAWSTRHTSYVVTDLCRGGTAESDDSEPRRSTIRAVAEALSHCHARGIVHADVKPENVGFLTAPGQDPVLLDFGLSVRLPRPGGTRRGTPLYVAPEVIERAPWGPACDVWSLGVSVFRMATGRFPFEPGKGNGTTTKELFWRILTAEPPIETVGDEALRDLLSGMLAKDPAARPKMSEVLAHRWMLAAC